jgi:hypothetical protein
MAYLGMEINHAKPSKHKQGEAHPQLLKRIAQQCKTQAMIHMARLSKDP